MVTPGCDRIEQSIQFNAVIAEPIIDPKRKTVSGSTDDEPISNEFSQLLGQYLLRDRPDRAAQLAEPSITLAESPQNRLPVVRSTGWPDLGVHDRAVNAEICVLRSIVNAEVRCHRRITSELL